jgi:hypothetical protein
MANTYSWNCKTVDCYPTFDDETDVVYNIHWRLTATSSDVDAEGNPYVASVYGTQSISTDDIENFIPFADLTNTIVTSNIESQINPTSVTLQIENDSVASEEEASE